jgi:hypothetical protein
MCLTTNIYGLLNYGIIKQSLVFIESEIVTSGASRYFGRRQK